MNARSGWSRIGLTLGATVAYVLVFLALRGPLGNTAAILAILPVIAAAWLFGLRGGLLAGILSFPLNSLLVVLFLDSNWSEWFQSGGALGSAALMVVGGAAGRLHDLGEQLKQELVEREQLALSERDQRVLAEALREAGIRLGSALDLKTVLEKLLDLVTEVVPYDQGVILLLKGSRAHIACVQGYDRSDTQATNADRTFDVETVANLRWMIRTGQPLAIPMIDPKN